VARSREIGEFAVKVTEILAGSLEPVLLAAVVVLYAVSPLLSDSTTSRGWQRCSHRARGERRPFSASNVHRRKRRVPRSSRVEPALLGLRDGGGGLVFSPAQSRVFACDFRARLQALQARIRPHFLFTA